MTAGSELKLRRAAHHFNEAQDLLRAYKNPPPYMIRREENPAVGLSFWITLKRKPDDDIALAAGDCIHNLRSALDHIIYELSCHHRRKKHVGDTAFPILGDPDDWDQRGDMSGAHKLRAIPDAARAHIELLQPYHKQQDWGFWRREALLQLHQLDIADKHRKLNLAFANVPEHSVLYFHSGPQLKVIHVHEGRLDEGVETLLLRFDPIVDLKANVKPDTFLEVVFTELPVKEHDIEAAPLHLIRCVEEVMIEIKKFF